MMRNGRLRKVNTLLDIGGAKAHVLANGTAPLLLKRLQDPAPGGIGNSVQYAIQFLLRMRHSSKQ